MITNHLPLLAILSPLLSAPLCFIASRRLAWLIASLAVIASLVISLSMLLILQDADILTYHMGGWPPPWGIEYRIDRLNALLLVLVTSIATLVMPYAWRSVDNEIAADKQALFYSALMLCLSGLMGMAVTGDVFNVFVFLEISSLSSYALISMGRDRRALTAAYQYLIMGTIGGTFILIGIGFMYMTTGTLNMADLAERLPPLTDSRATQVAFAFIVVGVSLKLALFPLHLWLPNAYTYAPSVVSIFLSATATKVAVYVLLRFTFDLFQAHQIPDAFAFGDVLIFFSCIAIVMASLGAIYQQRMGKVLAYSSVAQIGYITMGIGLLSTTGIAAGVVHLINHALIKGGLFMAVGMFAYRYHQTDLLSLAGAGKKMPWTAAAFVLGGLSLIGVPLTAGFISKWILLEAIFEKGWWPLAIIVLLGSLLAVIYIWRIIEILYFQPAATESKPVREAPLSLLLPAWLLILANIYFGVDTQFTRTLAFQAANLLMGNPS